MTATILVFAAFWLTWLGYLIGHQAGVRKGRAEARRRHWSYLDELYADTIAAEEIQP